MKRLTAVLLSLCMILSLGACNSSDYSKAEKLLEQGEYDSAIEIFEVLGDYKQAAELLSEAKYRKAKGCMSQEDYDTAIVLLEEIEGYSDSAVLLEESRGRNALKSMEEGKRILYSLDGEVYDRERAEKAFQKAADMDYADAWYYLGLLVQRSSENDRFEMAMDYFDQAILLGSDLGLLGKGTLYEYGRGTDRYYDKAQKLYEEALSNGCVEANMEIGNLYREAHGVERDCALALDYYEKALESSEPGYARDTYAAIGLIYEQGLGGIQTDDTAANEWFQKGIEAGSDEAIRLSGRMYLDGYGVERNTETAKKLFLQASELGNAAAMSDYALVIGNDPDDEEGFREKQQWYERSFEAGCSEGAFRLGNLYRNKYDDFEKAFEYYQKVIDSGNPRGYLGIGYSYDMQHNRAKALEWYEKGSALGDAECMYDIGLLYEYGEGVTRSYSTALEWYQKAAEAGAEWAMLKVGCFLYGEYGRKYAGDKNEAWRYLSDSALHGVCNAMCGIAEYFGGHLYSEGSYKDNNPEFRLVWYGKALSSNPNDHIANRSTSFVDQMVSRGEIDRETADRIIKEQAEHYILP